MRVVGGGGGGGVLHPYKSATYNLVSNSKDFAQHLNRNFSIFYSCVLFAKYLILFVCAQHFTITHKCIIS